MFNFKKQAVAKMDAIEQFTAARHREQTELSRQYDALLGTGSAAALLADGARAEISALKKNIPSANLKAFDKIIARLGAEGLNDVEAIGLLQPALIAAQRDKLSGIPVTRSVEASPAPAPAEPVVNPYRQPAEPSAPRTAHKTKTEQWAAIADSAARTTFYRANEAALRSEAALNISPGVLRASAKTTAQNLPPILQEWGEIQDSADSVSFYRKNKEEISSAIRKASRSE